MASKGVLYIVSTPIGNLEDISLRAIATLKLVDFIAAEDTRHSKRLLENYQVSTPMFSLHEHNEVAKTKHVKSLLDEGKNLALISDAGTPLISDPGYRVVKFLREEGYEVLSIPGACAAISALSVSGLPSDRFYFEGFLPAKRKQKQERLKELSALSVSFICYEAPHRLKATLEDVSDVLGEDCQVCLAREITKKFETIKLGKVKEVFQFVCSDAQQEKGECVVIINSGSEKDKKGKEDIDETTLALLEELSSHLPPKVSAQLVSKYSGFHKKQLYEHLISKKKRSR
jgi:16S rRNA (cytidine1402-2'-O)-methyltransferase